MNGAHAAGQRWTLADLIDFETLLAGVDETALEHDRLIFNRDIRPDLPHGDERARRRAGLRAWLVYRREAGAIETGSFWQQGLRLVQVAHEVGHALQDAFLQLELLLAPRRWQRSCE